MNPDTHERIQHAISSEVAAVAYAETRKPEPVAPAPAEPEKVQPAVTPAPPSQ